MRWSTIRNVVPPSETLRELDDRALKDIGLARCQIEAAVDGTLNPDMARLR